MPEIRCGSCRALLFKYDGRDITATIEIKCRRCGTINHLRPPEPLRDHPERRPERAHYENRRTIAAVTSQLSRRE